MDRALKIFGITIAMILVLSAPLVYAGGGEEAHGDDGHHGFDVMGFLGKLVNSVLLFGGLIFFLKKPISNLLGQKSKDVKNDILQREETLKNTGIQLEEIGKRLEKIEEEVIGMKQAAETSGKDEEKRIEELGKKEAQRILELTDAEISNRVENSVRNLKSRIADLTIDHFKSDIEKQLNKKAHDNIIEKNIEISGDIIERE